MSRGVKAAMPLRGPGQSPRHRSPRWRGRQPSSNAYRSDMSADNERGAAGEQQGTGPDDGHRCFRPPARPDRRETPRAPHPWAMVTSAMRLLAKTGACNVGGMDSGTTRSPGREQHEQRPKAGVGQREQQDAQLVQPLSSRIRTGRAAPWGGRHHYTRHLSPRGKARFTSRPPLALPSLGRLHHVGHSDARSHAAEASGHRRDGAFAEHGLHGAEVHIAAEIAGGIEALMPTSSSTVWPGEKYSAP